MRAENTLSVQALFDRLARPLELDWQTPRSGAGRMLRGGRPGADTLPLAGHLDFIRPKQVQLIGAAELRYLSDLDPALLTHGLDRLQRAGTAVVIAVDGHSPPTGLIERLRQADVAVLTTAHRSYPVLRGVRQMLSDALSQRINVHGVFMQILSVGVLITGKSGVGKSELALELISRGHRLVADDAPDFIVTAPEEVSGSCPREIQDFLEVRGLGILNIRAMYGDNAIRHRKKVDLMINLVDPHKSGLPHSDRLAGSRRVRELMGVPIPEIILPVAIGHNLAVLVETACRDHLLRLQGFAADEEFVRRHDAFLSGAKR